MNYNLSQPFYNSACSFPGRVAISTDREELFYRQVLEEVASVSAWLRSRAATPSRVGILASRSSEACIGILATAWIGATYVPINLALPPAAMAEILKRSFLDALIADIEGSKLLNAEVVAACPSMILARRDDVPSLSKNQITDYNDLVSPSGITEPVQVDKETPGYILYTSGSTGIPKGVIVPVGAVEHLLRVLDEKYALRETDRVAETAATTFDLSVYNMFAAWRAGASLHIISSKQMMAPSRFIRDHQLTIWLSVPSVATLMTRMKLLRPAIFPSLRQTIFAGEPLLERIATEWQKAAPSSNIINMYGPTETTVVCTSEDFVPGCAMTGDIVAIGRPFTGMKAAVADEKLNWLESGTTGELLLSGPQLALGYLDDPGKTQSKFVELNGERWYKTGDLARQDRNGVFHYIGRVDNQVKILGYRIELEDIESHLRAATGCDSVAVIPWPVLDGNVSGMMAFIAGLQGDVAGVKAAMMRQLPFYMVPTEFRTVPELPRNTNGKVDKKVLAELAAAVHVPATQSISWPKSA